MELYFYKHKEDWIGLTGTVIQSTAEEIAFGLKSISDEQYNSAILSANSPRWAIADYGIICSGGCTVSIYPTLIPSQIEFILNDKYNQEADFNNDEVLNIIDIYFILEIIIESEN